jgi:hypothetical protein
MMPRLNRSWALVFVALYIWLPAQAADEVTAVRDAPRFLRKETLEQL